jgi:hypothetical protein
MTSMVTSSMVPASSGFFGLGRAVRRLISDDGFEDRQVALEAIGEYEQFFLLAASHRPVSSYSTTFAKFGVFLETSDAPQAVVVDACIPFAVLQRRRQAEDRRREDWEAEQLRLAEQTRIEREKERQRRRAVRDAYYLDRGIKPGPLAWYRVLPDWLQAIGLGLSLALPVVVLLATVVHVVFR